MSQNSNQIIKAKAPPHVILINMEFDPKRRDSIIEAATQLAILLTSVGENLWVNTINHASALLKEDKFQDGTQLILSMYGGMGSLNDLIIDPYNGHPVSKESVESINRQLKSYLDKLYDLIKH
jgi:23S rRNA G2069 N7-methylase RlmK/C1962 C5-methylase RlmI